MPLSLVARKVGDVTIIRCGGRIAGGETESLRHQMYGLLQNPRDIILHLGEVAFIDSSGLGMLVRMLTSSRRAGGDLKLCNVPEGVFRVLKITNLTKLFDIHESEEDAVLSFYRKKTVAEQASVTGPSILCVDHSADVLACLRGILGSAGFDTLTNSNLHDSLILLRATRPKLIILGPNLMASPGTLQAFRAECAMVPVVELGAEFSSQDAAEAASALLAKIRSRLQLAGRAS
jgi:anti-sigma B factor antagonist